MTDLEAKARVIVAQMGVGCAFPVCPFDPCTCRNLITTALREARNQALDEAAAFLQSVGKDLERFEGQGKDDAEFLDAIAARIRSLKGD